MTNPSPHKLDIFEVIGNIDSKNREYYASLSEEEQKSIYPYVLMRWMTGSGNPRQLYFLNEVVNPYVFSLQKHKALIMNLMTICGSGRRTRFKWTKQAKKKSHATPKLIKLVQDYYGYNSSHAADALPLLTDEVLLSYAEQLGYQTVDIKALKKDLKSREPV